MQPLPNLHELFNIIVTRGNSTEQLNSTIVQIDGLYSLDKIVVILELRSFQRSLDVQVTKRNLSSFSREQQYGHVHWLNL